MNTDKIFYKLFQEFPNIFFEYIGQPGTNLDLYNFKSQEIKETSFRLDGIFLTLESAVNEPIYFVEVQCYKDELFYDRFISSIMLYFYQYQPSNPDWYAIVIFDTRSHDVNYPQRLNSLREPHLRCFYLNEMEEDIEDESFGLGIIKLVAQGKRKAKILAKQLVRKINQEVSDVATQRKALELIEAIIVNKFPKLSREEVKEMLTMDLIRGTRFYEELKEEAREEVKQEVKEQVKQEVKEQVKQEVKEQVKQEVKLESKLELVPRLIQRGISVEEVAAILELDLEVVRNAAPSNS